MDINFTARYIREDDWWIAFAEEFGVCSQGKTLDEARWMIKDAVQMKVADEREQARRNFADEGHADAIPPEQLTVGDDEVVPPQPTVQEYLDSPDYEADLAEFGPEAVGPRTQLPDEQPEQPEAAGEAA